MHLKMGKETGGKLDGTYIRLITKLSWVQGRQNARLYKVNSI